MNKHLKSASLFLIGLFITAPVLATILTITYTSESPNSTIRSSHWNQNFNDVQNFLNSNQLNSTDNLQALGVSTGALANLAVTNAKLNPIDGSNKISGASFYNLSSTPSGAGVIPIANLPTQVPTNFRSQMYVSQASTATITVAPGIVEVNGSSLAKTANTTLTLSNAGDWAGGSSLRAVSTLAFVGIDASGNLKMHTTAPTHADYALTITAANNTKRYATWSGTVYRIIGWFYMNSTGSGELDAFGVSNIADCGVTNVVEFQTAAYATGSTAMVADDTIPQNTEGDQYMSQVFRPTNVNNKLRITILANTGYTASGGLTMMGLFQDATANALAAVYSTAATSDGVQTALTHHMKAATTSLTTFKVRIGGTAGKTIYFNGNTSLGGRIFGGVCASSIRIEEIESQLT